MTLFRLRLQAFLFGLLALTFVGCTTNVQHGLTEQQANQIIVLFAKNQIEANKIPDTSGREVVWTIQVPKSDMTKAIRLLQQNNLPPRKEKGLSEVYSEGGMIPTATEEKAKYVMALSGELNMTLKRINGVLDARVHLVIPEQRILKSPGEKQPEPSASVLLMMAKGAPAINSLQIKALVAGSLEGLSPNNVNVVSLVSVDSEAGTPSTPGKAGQYTDEDLTKILGARILSDDVGRIRLILGGLLLVLALAAIAAIAFFIRSMSLKNQIKALQSTSFSS